jgi:guanosine-3',5'-bis(diphosphate) 3'-pyrophosphohydrolase
MLLRQVTRVKGMYSLYRKLLKKDMNIEKVYDIVALRVIVPTIEACYQTLGVIHSHWRPFPGRIKDYIALPKPNGYQSIHTTIFTGNGTIAELQIRTQEMHEHAEYGIAAHFTYKGMTQKEKEEHLQWLQDMQEFNIKEKASPKDFFNALKGDFFKKRIFVFTPEGDVINLPEDASPIDFAFAIHTDIGKHLSSVEINGKHGSIYTKLSNGDVVKAVPLRTSNPTSKWLDYAKTSLARKQINKYLEDNSLMNKFMNKFRN